MLKHRVDTVKPKQAGFTLIELLIVIAIIAILAAIAIPQFLKYKQGAYIDSARSDVKNAVASMEAFAAKYGDYPALSSTITCGPGPIQCDLTDSKNNTETNALNVSTGNTVTIGPNTNTNTTCTDGYVVSAYNTNISSGPGSQGDAVSYDSCTGAYTGF